MLSDVLYIGGWIKRNKFKIPIVLVISLVLFTGIGLSFAGGGSGTDYSYKRGITGSNSSLILPLNQSTTGGSRGVPR